jgi:type II secretory pathway pseudopilin PulG
MRRAFLMRSGRASGQRAGQGGFTYLGVLVLVVLTGLMLSAAGEVASTQARREREVELLFIGHQYRAAIARYVRTNRHWPMTLADLVQDTSNALTPQHFLRRLYQDPMTRSADWTLLPAPNGGFMGVASTSAEAPLKHAGFDPEDVDFDKAEKYSDWAFIHDPRRNFRPPAPAGGGAPSR